MKNIAWKQILAVFMISFVLGTAFGRWQETCQIKNKWKHRENREAWILKRIDSKLHLNAEQKEKVAAILKEAAPSMDRIHQEIMPKMEAVRAEVREKIMPLLDDNQKKKYDEMEAEWQKKKRRHPPAPPPED